MKFLKLPYLPARSKDYTESGFSTWSERGRSGGKSMDASADGEASNLGLRSESKRALFVVAKLGEDER